MNLFVICIEQWRFHTCLKSIVTRSITLYKDNTVHRVITYYMNTIFLRLVFTWTFHYQSLIVFHGIIIKRHGVQNLLRARRNIYIYICIYAVHEWSEYWFALFVSKSCFPHVIESREETSISPPRARTSVATSPETVVHVLAKSKSGKRFFSPYRTIRSFCLVAQLTTRWSVSGTKATVIDACPAAMSSNTRDTVSHAAARVLFSLEPSN